MTSAQHVSKRMKLGNMLSHACMGRVTASVFLGFFVAAFAGAGFLAAQQDLSLDRPLQALGNKRYCGS